MEDSDTAGRILVCARDLFTKYGIRSITMDDIAHHLGISKKTIYQHFSDKDQIVTIVIRQSTSEAKGILTSLSSDVKDAVQTMMVLHDHVRKYFNDKTTSVLFDLQKYHTEAWNVVNEFRTNFMTGFIKQILEQGITQGYFRQDIHPDIIAKMRIEQAGLVDNSALFPKERFKKSEVADSILEHFIQGISTDSGRKLYKKYKQQQLKNNESH